MSLELAITKLVDVLNRLDRRAEEFLPFSGRAGADYLTRQQAADYINVTAATLGVWGSTKKNEIPYIKLGKATMYKKEDLDAYIAKRKKRGLKD